MKLLILCSVLATVMPAQQAAHIPSDAFHGGEKLLDASLRDTMENLVGPMTLKREEGLDGPCKSPQVFEGRYYLEMFKFNRTQEGMAYSFDGEGKRIRLLALTTQGGKRYLTNTVILAKKKIMYSVVLQYGVCTNKTYDHPWQPAGAPSAALYYGTAHLAGLSVENEGLLLDFYNAGDNLAAVTRYGCWEAFSYYNTSATGRVLTTYYDLTPGIKDPSVFDIPKACH